MFLSPYNSFPFRSKPKVAEISLIIDYVCNDGISVTRFGDISPLWNFLKDFGNLKGFIQYIAKFGQSLEQIFFDVNDPNIEKVMQPSGHTDPSLALCWMGIDS